VVPSGIDTFVDAMGEVGGKVRLPRRTLRFGGDGDDPNELQVWATWTSLPYRDLYWRSDVCKRAWAGYGLSRTVRGFTRPTGGRYSHLAFRRGPLVWEATETGVREGLARSFARYNIGVDAYAIQAEGRQHHAARLRILGASAAGTPYDFGDLFDHAAERILARVGLELYVKLRAGTAALICSEFVPFAYQAEGPALCAALGLAHPADFVPDHIAHLYARRPALCAWRGRVVF